MSPWTPRERPGRASRLCAGLHGYLHHACELALCKHGVCVSMYGF